MGRSAGFKKRSKKDRINEKGNLSLKVNEWGNRVLKVTTNK
jgi:hypothetical protein